jgi:hypothetical protein
MIGVEIAVEQGKGLVVLFEVEQRGVGKSNHEGKEID